MVVRNEDGASVLKCLRGTRNQENTIGLKAARKQGKSSKRICLKAAFSPKKPLASSSNANIDKNIPVKQQNILPKTPTKVPISPDVSPPVKIEGSPEVLSTPSSTSSDSFAFSPVQNDFGDDGSCGGNSLGNDGSISMVSNAAAVSRKRLGHQLTSPATGPPVSRRNARERNRVKQVSLGFNLLRQHIPQADRKKKPSKVETLRCAVDYIRNMKNLLAENPIPSVVPATTSNTVTMYQPLLSQEEQFITQDMLFQKEQAFQQQSNIGSHLFHGSFQQNDISPDNIESHVLKVPKPQENYPTRLLYQNQFTSSAFYPKQYTPLEGFTDLVEAHQQDIKPFLPVLPHTSNKDGEVELLEALAWWQTQVQ